MLRGLAACPEVLGEVYLNDCSSAYNCGSCCIALYGDFCTNKKDSWLPWLLALANIQL